HLSVAAIRELIKTGIRFPWVLCDEKEEYRGVLTQEDELKYLASCLIKSLAVLVHLGIDFRWFDDR
ncbi:hypothetical protein ACVZHT_12155, partial [Vibrio diabolicus]